MNNIISFQQTKYYICTIIINMKYIFLSLISCYSAFSQKTTSDTTKSKLLDDVTVQGYRANESTIKQLPDVHQNYIIAFHKNERFYEI